MTSERSFRSPFTQSKSARVRTLYSSALGAGRRRQCSVLGSRADHSCITVARRCSVTAGSRARESMSAASLSADGSHCGSRVTLKIVHSTAISRMITLQRALRDESRRHMATTPWLSIMTVRVRPAPIWALGAGAQRGDCWLKSDGQAPPDSQGVGALAMDRPPVWALAQP